MEKALGKRAPEEGLDLTHGTRRKTWLCWVVQSWGAVFPFYLFPLWHQTFTSCRADTGRPHKDQSPRSSSTWVCGWVRTETPRAGEAGTVRPPSTFPPLRKHKEDEGENCQSRKFLWLLTTQVCTLCGIRAAEPYSTASPSTWTRGLCLLQAPPLCIGCSSIN